MKHYSSIERRFSKIDTSRQFRIELNRSENFRIEFCRCQTRVVDYLSLHVRVCYLNFRTTSASSCEHTFSVIDIRCGSYVQSILVIIGSLVRQFFCVSRLCLFTFSCLLGHAITCESLLPCNVPRLFANSIGLDDT